MPRRAEVHLGGAGGAWGWGERGGVPSFCLASLQPAVAQSLPDLAVAACQTEVPGATRAPAVSGDVRSVPQVQGC